MTREYIIEKLKKDIDKEFKEYEKEIYNKALEDIEKIMWADGDMFKMYIDEFYELKG